MSWNSSWPTILKSLGKLSLLGLYLTEWGLLAFHDLRTFVIIRRIFLLNYLRVRQFELYGEFYMFSWWKDLRQMPRRNPRLGTAKELSQNLAETWCGRWLVWIPNVEVSQPIIKFSVQRSKFYSVPFTVKFSGTNGNSEKVVPFSRLGRSEWKFVYHLQVSWVSYWFHVVTRIQSSAVRQSGNFRQMVNNTYRSYGPKIPDQYFRNFFINGKQPCFRFSGWNLSVAESHYFRRHPTRI